ncbi:MAG TPA: hypothetical protein PLO37_13965 [Candidatus Hydrogenedentes bacterium]|mgnify:CR=1 FL=1|nr:hypothetical protein [Candidatus Hydrogenedentota bacterium]HPG67950.1 hypothetical protein [Candidatus Hydrogenedentota bacterium]
MRRRDFMQHMMLIGALSAARSGGSFGDVRIRTLTRGPKHHFFGYYGICPWNASGRYLVGLETTFQDRFPSPGERAAIGLADPETGAFRTVTDTAAWNFQQGAMLHWNPTAPEHEILFNDVVEGRLGAVIADVRSGDRRVLPRAINAVRHDGQHALCVDFGRLGRLRPVVGYAGAEDPCPKDPHPATDGVWRMDLDSGEVKLIVSLAQVYEMLTARGVDTGQSHLWFNHTLFNRTGTRFLFLARTRKSGGSLETGMFTADADGADLREVIPYGRSVSHFDWRNDREIVATFCLNGRDRTHVLFTDGQENYRRIGDGLLDFDGHCSFAPDGNGIVTDRNVTKGFVKQLIIHNVVTGEHRVLGDFPMGDVRYWTGDLRCDLHPRWSRAGRAVCFDAISSQDGTRQIHVAEFDS